jgi:hypothetical protein
MREVYYLTYGEDGVYAGNEVYTTSREVVIDAGGTLKVLQRAQVFATRRQALAAALARQSRILATAGQAVNELSAALASEAAAAQQVHEATDGTN